MGCGGASFFCFLSSHLLAEAEAITMGGGRRTPNVSGRMLTMAGLFDIWRRKPNVSDCVHINTSHQSHNINVYRAEASPGV